MKTNTRMLNRQIERCSFILNTIKYCSSRYSVTSPDFYRFLSRSLLLFRKERFVPEELYQFGIALGPLTPGHLGQFASRKKMTRVQSNINPPGAEVMTEDKALFSRLCHAYRLSSPRTYAVFYKHSPGLGMPDTPLRDSRVWCRFILEALPERFIIKPCRGVYGREVIGIHRTNDHFTDHLKRPLSAQDLFDFMSSSLSYSSFIIQEWLDNHPDLCRLSGSRGLQTARLITLIDHNGNFSLLHAFFKPIVGENIIDNHDNGRTGNLVAQIDPSNGTLFSADLITGNGDGIRRVDIHPKTGAPIRGTKLPLWDETKALAEAAAYKFLPLRTIGWDIAVTPKGPALVEGNAWWDPPNFNRAMKRIMPHLLDNQNK